MYTKLFDITHEGKTQEEYEAEINAAAKAMGLENASGLHIDYAARVEMVQTQIAGNNAIITISQRANYRDDVNEMIPQPSGSIYLYVVTPHAFYGAQDVNLETYNGLTTALDTYKQLKGAIAGTSDVEQWLNEQAKANFELWWSTKLSSIIS